MSESHFFSCLSQDETILANLVLVHRQGLAPESEAEIIAAARKRFVLADDEVLEIAQPLPAIDAEWAGHLASQLLPDLVTADGLKMWWLPVDLEAP